ncbi:MAG: branched-chain amino acid ABC transporter ATP-binding protein/permease [Ilumatobacteraceae bacterium]
MTDPTWLRLGRSLGASAVMVVVLFAGSTLYTATGGSARELLVKELLINLMLVLGLQIFIGNTGILSFGHLAFAQIAAYTVALLTIPVAVKQQQLPDIPFGLGTMHLGAFPATLVAIGMALLVGGLIGIAVVRAGGIAATMITLAVLFVVDQLVKNWQELTKGAGGLSSVPPLGGTLGLWVGGIVGLVVAHWFAETRPGRFAVATREDEIAAPSLGIGLFGSRYVAWIVSIGLVGLAGALRVQAIGSTSPKQYTLDVTVLLLAMLVVGGMRTPTGAVVGTILITVGNEVFRQLGDPKRLDIDRFPDLFLGVTLLAAMLWRPSGLLGDIDLGAWLRRRTRRPHQPVVRINPIRTASLTASSIGVTFGGFTALRDAHVRVGPGEVVGIIGPNGAGKTTLFNVVTGLVSPVNGTVRLGEQELTNAAPEEVARAGLARTFQNLRLFGNLTVLENVTLTALVSAKYRPDEAPIDVAWLLQVSGLAGFEDRTASTLDYGNQRRLELARAAALSPEFLLLDEPTSGMSDDESIEMVERIRTMGAAVGAGVLVIDHDLAFITMISDHIVALGEGTVIAEGTPKDIRRDPHVMAAYLGSEARDDAAAAGDE